jgi:hypothetical protein
MDWLIFTLGNNYEVDKKKCIHVIFSSHPRTLLKHYSIEEWSGCITFMAYILA